MDEQIMTNEVNVEEPTTNVVAAPETTNTMPEIYVPDSTCDANSSGPNKALIALAIGGGLLVAKPAIKKVKSLMAKHKEKKEAREEEQIMKVLTKTGLIVPVKEDAITEVVDQPQTKSDIPDVKTTEEKKEK